MDRLAFCMNVTRSGVLANMVARFVTATEATKQGRASEKALAEYLTECRKAVNKGGVRGAYEKRAELSHSQ